MIPKKLMMLFLLTLGICDRSVSPIAMRKFGPPC
jgi:hypothetical protein